MRTMCLALSKSERPSIAETFLAFSTRVHYRAPGLIFLDAGQAAQRFGGESGLLNEVRRLTGEFFPGATAAVADTPAAAQVLSRIRPFSIVEPEHENNELNALPLSALVHLEGLVAWRTLRDIENVIDFFYGLGIQRIGDLKRFSGLTLSEKFGATGSLLWRRLHGQERQVISPLIPSGPLAESIYFDFGVSLLPLLLHSIEKSLVSLTARLHGRQQRTQKVLLHLHCENGRRYHLIEIEPQPGRHFQTEVMDLIEDQLVHLDLCNPVKELSIELVLSSSPPSRLLPIAPHKGLGRMTSGYLRAEAQEPREVTWESEASADFIELAADEEDIITIDDQNLRLDLRYADAAVSPRLETHLSEPLRLSQEELAHFRFLSTKPLERAQNGEWESSRGRSYFMALSPEGDPCWICFDRIENEHYRL